jgi:Ubiquitin 3 binding protein But2 C-terminal domain
MHFSTVAAAAAVLIGAASAAPLSERGNVIFTKGADFIHPTSQADPNTDQASKYPNQGVISRTNENNEWDSFISFAIPAMNQIPGASPSSTCSFVVKNPAVSSGSGIAQLFTVGAPFTKDQTITYNQHPFINEYFGAYQTRTGGDSNAIDVSSFPCQFGENMQFALRPQNDNDNINWTQNGNVGAFIVISN